MSVVFVVVCIWFVLELPCSFSRYNFVDILAASLILSMYFLGIFDKHFIRLCIVAVFVCFIADLVWILVMRQVTIKNT